jgi:hypothetical protein
MNLQIGRIKAKCTGFGKKIQENEKKYVCGSL